MAFRGRGSIFLKGDDDGWNQELFVHCPSEKNFILHLYFTLDLWFFPVPGDAHCLGIFNLPYQSDGLYGEQEVRRSGQLYQTSL